MTPSADGRRLLLISPAFHGYHHGIARGFEEVGYDVVTHRYDALDSFAMKARNKAWLELPERWGVDRHRARSDWDTRRAVEAVRRTEPDRVIVIKGDTLGEDLWGELADRRIPVILWLYDDLARHRHSIEFLRTVGPVLSYAATEAQQLRAMGVRAHHLPNAYDPHLLHTAARPGHGCAAGIGEVVFVGSRYPNRVDLLNHLHGNGVSVRVYGRQWSGHPVDRLRTWEWARPGLPWHRDISLSEAYAVQAEAAAAVNIHGRQGGLSMRTFEVPGAGGLQLVDRADVAEFYEPAKEVLVFSDRDELLDLSRRAVADPAWGRRIREAGRRRSLAEHTFAHRAHSVEQWWES
ncbi:hypothetical protein EDL96_08000 [Kocuria soli]|uniref:Spore protein YkvP/CgeB glycosyl transferase-like domain-containing protein n=1 Tax=Kocuria soli TaxID=2485125 RepID=A0A3N4A3J9_9MICC|nr:glycosyltransferase [Kocuria soli]ROZ63041.1 hypothetical protein EDL96_08000 [Kocuria soli]